MALRSLMGGNTVVLHEGGRYVCRPPTCETVLLAMEHFGAELLGCRMAYRSNAAVYATVPIQVVLSTINDARRLAQILATCCELHGGAPGEIADRLAGKGGRELAAKLIAGVLAVCDLGHLIEATELDRQVDEIEKQPAEASTPTQDGPAAMEILAAMLGERFGIAPHEVMAWPYLAVIDLAEGILPALEKMRRPRGPEVFGLSAEEWEDEGVTLTH